MTVVTSVSIHICSDILTGVMNEARIYMDHSGEATYQEPLVDVCLSSLLFLKKCSQFPLCLAVFKFLKHNLSSLCEKFLFLVCISTVAATC